LGDRGRRRAAAHRAHPRRGIRLRVRRARRHRLRRPGRQARLRRPGHLGQRRGERRRRGPGRRHARLRFAKISSDVDENLFDAGGALVESLVASTDLVGFGLAAGGELRWNVCGGFSFYGRAAGGILLSTIEGSVVHNNAVTTLTNASNDIERLTPFIEMGVGIGWGSERIFGSCVGLNVDLGFELTNWFNVLDPLTYIDDVKDSALGESSDDLGITAVTLKVTLTF
jgi:hypothetical protein